MDGVPVVGGVGAWSLDKRHYFGAPPPNQLEPPPPCAQECAWTWWRMFNEAIGNLSSTNEWCAAARCSCRLPLATCHLLPVACYLSCHSPNRRHRARRVSLTD